MEEEFSNPKIGEIVDKKYQIDNKLASGGMGIVWEVTHIGLERKFALKSLRPEIAKNEKCFARFKREARLVAKIEHEHICEVTDFGTTKCGIPYFVMPLLTGKPLGDLLEKGLEPSRFLTIITQVLSALEAAHKCGIVHRDLKPENIFVAETSLKQDDVKILDFGISKIIDGTTGPGLTVTGEAIGTPDYMSPEQVKGDKDLDQCTDIYAVGVILYLAVTGRLPFARYVDNTKLLHIMQNDCVPPKSLNPWLPDEINEVIVKAMAPLPDNRYKDASEFIEALRGSFGQVQTTPSKGRSVEEIDTGIAKENRDGSSNVSEIDEHFQNDRPSKSDILSSSTNETTNGIQKYKKLRYIIRLGIGFILLLSLMFAIYILTETTKDEYASLKLSTKPSGASIKIDGKKTHETTPAIIKNLKKGKIEVVLEKGNSYFPKVMNLEIEQEGKTTSPITVNLVPRYVQYNFVSVPSESRVTLISNSQKKILGTSPVDHQIDLAKENKVEYSLPDYETSLMVIDKDLRKNKYAINETLTAHLMPTPRLLKINEWLADKHKGDISNSWCADGKYNVSFDRKDKKYTITWYSISKQEIRVQCQIVFDEKGNPRELNNCSWKCEEGRVTTKKIELKVLSKTNGQYWISAFRECVPRNEEWEKECDYEATLRIEK